MSRSSLEAGNILQACLKIPPPLVFVRFPRALPCRMLEQLRKQQGSVLHPDYSSPFRSFEDSLHRLLPYHLYQGTASSQHDYQKGKCLALGSLRTDEASVCGRHGTAVTPLPLLSLFISLVDSEFENVSCQLLKRTRAMLDKYRHLLFEESKVVVFIQFGLASVSSPPQSGPMN